MTVIEFHIYRAVGMSVWRGWRRALRIALITMKRRRRQLAAHLELSRLDEKMLYDLGIDPLAVRDALRDHRSKALLSPQARRHLERR